MPPRSSSEKNMENKSKKMLVLLGVIVVIVLIIVVAASQGKKTGTQQTPVVNTPAQTTPGTGETATTTTTAPVVNEVLKDATIAAPGANPITKDNKVVTQEGKQTVNNVDQTSPLAPSETGPISKADLPASVIKLDISAAGFTPKEFTVRPGAAVTISITATDAFAHSLVFDDPSLSALGVGVYSNETRAISFNAPTKAGSYIFYCNVGNHRSRGEVGTMIVR